LGEERKLRGARNRKLLAAHMVKNQGTRKATSEYLARRAYKANHKKDLLGPEEGGLEGRILSELETEHVVIDEKENDRLIKTSLRGYESFGLVWGGGETGGS